MNSLSTQDLRSLIDRPCGPCITILMPTHHHGTDAFQNPIRLKNLLRRAEQQLAARGYGEAEVSDLLELAGPLVDEELLAEHHSAGLAVFIASDCLRRYYLPFPVEETVVVSDRFTIRPLLPFVHGDGRFYVLALSHNAVRLLECTRDTVHEVELPETPHSLAESTRYLHTERQLQLHTGGAGHSAVFHSAVIDREEDKVYLHEFFREIDHGLHDRIAAERAPLVLAAAEYLLPIYSAVSTYPCLLPKGIAGCPDRLSNATLHAQAWPLAAPLFQEDRRLEWQRYEQKLGTGMASNDITEIVPATAYGRVATLFVAPDRSEWGAFDVGSREVQLHPDAGGDAQDLINLAAVETLLHGGTVYTVPPDQLPADRPAAALLRY
jgi:hypothetical protein